MASPPEVIHIVSSITNNPDQLRANILHGFSAPEGNKSLPTTILYDERGLELYDDITTLAGEHYYLFPCEEHILKHYAPDVINVMCARDVFDDDGDVWHTPTHTRGVLLELGSGYVLRQCLSSSFALTTSITVVPGHSERLPTLFLPYPPPCSMCLRIQRGRRIHTMHLTSPPPRSHNHSSLLRLPWATTLC